MKDVMLDLETLGTQPTAAIVAIGAVAFDLVAGENGEPFYVAVDLQSAVGLGMTVDASTVLWWLKQSDEARASTFTEHGTAIHSALNAFSAYLSHFGPDVRVWGNGAAFDNVILGEAYRMLGTDKPWKFWNDRCFRTVKALNYDVKEPVRAGTRHNALHDAVHQANHLHALRSARRV